MRQTQTHPEAEQQSLEHEATHTLEEARLVLPGVQALFGFQLIAVYSAPFEKQLSSGEQGLHLAGLLVTALSIVMLLTPAAYHRQAEPHQISRLFLRLSSGFLTVGMFLLMTSIHIDCYLIARIILKHPPLPEVLTGISGVIYLVSWFSLPRMFRRRLQSRGRS